MNTDKITVMQVFSVLGIAPTPDVSWSVGALVASRYQKVVGEQPPKENRPKTGGGGSHCFAIYPRSWRAEIESAIRSVTKQSSSQVDMFSEAA